MFTTTTFMFQPYFLNIFNSFHINSLSNDVITYKNVYHTRQMNVVINVVVVNMVMKLFRLLTHVCQSISRY